MVELRIKIISIHALREEGDAQIEVKVFDDFLFLSTPSARRATLLIPSNHLEGEYFYPRPPRGGRRSASSSMTASSIFLSTPSARRATVNPQGIYKYIYISIHALREEGDDVAEGSTVLMDISIHALREEGDSRRP